MYSISRCISTGDYSLRLGQQSLLSLSDTAKMYIVPLQLECRAQELLLSYNIGVDRNLTRQQTLHRSARSVGLELPVQEE